MKLILIMAKVGDDISSVYDSSVSKCTQGGIGVLFGCQCWLRCWHKCQC